MTDSQPLPEIIHEARRTIDAARAQDVPIRLIGGLAVRLRADDRFHPELARPYKDIDIVTTKRGGKATIGLLESLGYIPDREFNALHGATRLLFFDLANQRQLDVFVGAFEMCHSIPMTDRILREDMTVPLAELVLTKLQVVKINEKDLRDIVALLLHHEVSDEDGPTINAAYMAELCGGDWGLWRTCKMNIARAREGVAVYGLDEHERATVLDRADAIWARIDASPKSTKWKLRDKIGDRKRWYLDPEEVSE